MRATQQFLLITYFFAEFATAAPLSDLLADAFERNPDVRAAQLAWRASIEAVPQASSLPDPMLGFDYFGENVETRVGPQEWRAGISQSFPFPGTLAQAGEVASRESRIQELAYQIVVRDTIVDLKLSYFELLYLRGAITITQHNQALLQHILQLANARYALEKAKLQDVLKAQSQLAQLGYDLILLRELEVVETAKLNALLDRPTDAEIGELVFPELRSPQLDPKAVEEAALNGRQEIEMARARVDKLEATVELAHMKNRPSFSINAMHIETGEARFGSVSDSGKDPWVLGVAVSLPIWRDRNEARVAEAELNAESASLKQSGLENKTRAALKSLLFRLENARRLTLLYQNTLIPQAKAAMAVAEQWHDGESADVSGLLETQSVWLNFNLARLRALVDHQQYVARLERLVGGKLPEVTP
jgi:cobalt-zinc-cadmium efflux system outer membrane protein